MKSAPKARKAAAQLRRTAPKKPRAYHKGNVTEDLLKAASRILGTERVEDISVRRLAREVGVTPANFYNHFPSLDDLLLNLAADGFDAIRHDAEAIIASRKSRREALLQRSWLFVEFAMANKQLFRVMFGYLPNSASHDRFREASNASFGQLVYLVYGKDIFDPSDLEATHSRSRAAYAVFALVYGLARNIIEEQFQFKTGNRAEIKQFVEDAVSTMLDGTLTKELAS
ncbi:MAG TPA: TetR/AcrR family transcriptional regulator [Rhizomicrobium sp.]|jgi:AcrR family transcriptional regulator